MNMINFQPHYIEGMKHFLESVLGEEKTLYVLEIGSGFSTPWLASRAYKVYTIEHDAAWYEASERWISGVYNVSLNLVPRYWETFINEINRGFDIVIADGADEEGARVAVMKAVWRWVNPGGWLFVDDTDREEYSEGVKFLDSLGWPKVSWFGEDIYGRKGRVDAYYRLPSFQI